MVLYLQYSFTFTHSHTHSYSTLLFYEGQFGKCSHIGVLVMSCLLAKKTKHFSPPGQKTVALFLIRTALCAHYVLNMLCPNVKCEAKLWDKAGKKFQRSVRQGRIVGTCSVQVRRQLSQGVCQKPCDWSKLSQFWIWVWLVVNDRLIIES